VRAGTEDGRLCSVRELETRRDVVDASADDPAIVWAVRTLGMDGL
jgi:hypothetical protein